MTRDGAADSEQSWFGFPCAEATLDGQRYRIITIPSEAWSDEYAGRVQRAGEIGGLSPILRVERGRQATVVHEAVPAGPTLSNMLDDDTRGEALAVVAAAAEAVHAAHLAGLTHGALGPDDLHVDRSGPATSVLVSGMGLGHGGALDPARQRFAAPELLAGASPTTRADVFSLGQILAGLAGAESPALRELATEATDHDPSARPATAHEFGRRLAEASAAGGNADDDGSPRRAAVLAAAVVAAAVVAMATQAWWGLDQPGPEGPTAPAALVAAAATSVSTTNGSTTAPSMAADAARSQQPDRSTTALSFPAATTPTEPRVATEPVVLAPLAATEASSSFEFFHALAIDSVDLYLGSELAADGLAPGTLVGPLPVDALDQPIDLFPAVPEPSRLVDGRTDVPLLGGPVPLDGPGTVVAFTDEQGSPALAGFARILEPVPAGSGRLAVRTVAGVGPTSIFFADDELATEVPPGTSAVIEPESGPGTLRLVDGEGQDLVAADLEVSEGALTTVWVHGPPGAVSLSLRQVAGLHSAPSGVPAGGEGLMDEASTGRHRDGLVPAVLVMATLGLAGIARLSRSVG